MNRPICALKNDDLVRYMQENQSLDRVPRGSSLWKIATQELHNRGEDSKDPSCVWKEVKRLAAINGIEGPNYKIKENQFLRLYDKVTLDSVRPSLQFDVPVHQSYLSDPARIPSKVHSEVSKTESRSVANSESVAQLEHAAIDSEKSIAVANGKAIAAIKYCT